MESPSLSAPTPEGAPSSPELPAIEGALAPPPPPTASPARRWDYWLLWVVALTSLALNVMLINTLLGVRRQAAEAAGLAADGLTRVRAATFSYTVVVDQSIPVNVSIPINQSLTVPIDTVIPINTTVQVPIEVPLLGTRLVSFPIQTTIPVKLETEIPVNLVVPISATVPVQLDVPIQLAVADTPFDGPLADAQRYLARLSDQLGQPLIFGSTPTATPRK